MKIIRRPPMIQIFMQSGWGVCTMGGFCSNENKLCPWKCIVLHFTLRTARIVVTGLIYTSIVFVNAYEKIFLYYTKYRVFAWLEKVFCIHIFL